MKRFLLQMAGLPGTGKSALAQAIGERTKAVVVDKDVIMTGAIRANVRDQAAGGLAYEIGFELAESFLRQGHNVVLDSPANFIIIREKGHAIAHRVGLPYFIIECLVPELTVAVHRIETRQVLHHLHPRTLEGLDLTFSRPGTGPLSEPHLKIDTTRPLGECLDEALAYIGYGQS